MKSVFILAYPHAGIHLLPFILVFLFSLLSENDCENVFWGQIMCFCWKMPLFHFQVWMLTLDLGLKFDSTLWGSLVCFEWYNFTVSWLVCFCHQKVPVYSNSCSSSVIKPSYFHGLFVFQQFFLVSFINLGKFWKAFFHSDIPLLLQFLLSLSDHRLHLPVTCFSALPPMAFWGQFGHFPRTCFPNCLFVLAVSHLLNTRAINLAYWIFKF